MSGLRDEIADALRVQIEADPPGFTDRRLANATLEVLDAWLAGMLSVESPPDQITLAEALLAHYPQPLGHDDHSCLVIHDDPRTPATVVIAALRSLAGGAS